VDGKQEPSVGREGDWLVGVVRGSWPVARSLWLLTVELSTVHFFPTLAPRTNLYRRLTLSLRWAAMGH
jgi:hypothetical protein